MWSRWCVVAWMLAVLACNEESEPAQPAEAVSTDVSVAPDSTPEVDVMEAEDASSVDTDTGDDVGPRIRLEHATPDAAQPCEVVEVQRVAEGIEGEVQYRLLGGYPVLHLESTSAGVRFRAPVVPLATEIVIEATAIGLDRSPVVDEFKVAVAAAPDDPDLAVGMAWDCAPFLHGVASGDPSAEALLIWTRLDADVDTVLTWTVATDPALSSVVASGEVLATAATDYTVEVDVTGLVPGSTYYYRFVDPSGAPSALGRSKTLPVGTPERFRVASMSCSSVWSGYFNAYGRLAEQTLDLVVHLGDYVYDFVDAEEEVRIPRGEFPTDPESADEWRTRHKYYLGDPNLRAARAAHPWMVMWDNHDVDLETDSITVFREYVPMRRPAPQDEQIAYRAIEAGDLVHLILVDALQFRDNDEGILGAVQNDWLATTLEGSTAAWRVLGNQKLVTALVGASAVGEASPWGGYSDSRSALFEQLAPLGNNVVLSGDLHFTIAHDLVTDPDVYDPATGAGSVGVELLAAGISRGNFDETLCAGLCADTALTDAIAVELKNENAHAVFYELIQHGYGVLDITDERVVAEMYYSPIRENTREESLGMVRTVFSGEDRWDREGAAE